MRTILKRDETRKSGQISPKGIVKGAPSPRGDNLKCLKNGYGRVAETCPMKNPYKVFGGVHWDSCPPKSKEANLKEKLKQMKEAWEIIKKGLVKK